MRSCPDFSGVWARGLAYLSLLGSIAGMVWLVQGSATAGSDGAADTSGSVSATDVVRPDAASAKESPVVVDELWARSERAWEDYVPAEIRERYAIFTSDELRRFLERVEAGLRGGSAARLAGYERDARRALKVLRRREGGDLLVAWLEPRLDLLRAAAQLEDASQASGQDAPSEAAPRDAKPGAPAATPSLESLDTVARPQYTRPYWDKVIGRRKPPRRAVELVPQLKQIFSAMGVPPELVWIAEVESSMNPEATSPVGARGLFQFMPLTASRFGLTTGVMIDERTDPEKSARAAAAYLRNLHRQFRSWPLALAAYNAGEGRVGRALNGESEPTFEAIAPRLPLETRLYVPKVLATVAARESIDPEELPPPLSREALEVRVVQDSPTPAAKGDAVASAPSSM